MSKYGWEQGTILLPTAAVKKVRDALITAQNAEHERNYQKARQWVKDNSKQWRKYLRTGDYRDQPRWGELGDEVIWAIEDKQGKLPTHADILPPKASNRTTSFKATGCGVTLQGRELNWWVEDNNHSVERAHESWLANTLFKELAQIKWTRGSGGVFYGNDEYNSDSSNGPYGGQNYITSSYGPKGKQTAGWVTDPKPVRYGFSYPYR